MGGRNYNKIYVHTDRQEGSEKLLLGYQNNVREFTLFKDKETLFHVPSYADTIHINESNLIESGAVAGTFPAAADRIYKNSKGYGNVTSNGTTTNSPNGTWYCSWLYKDEFGRVEWMDRFYNPGSLVISDGFCPMLEEKRYTPYDPVFRDVPSTMTLEPGVQYKYFHVGEKTNTTILNSYEGLSSSHLKLNASGWTVNSTQYDVSPNPVNVTIVTDAPSQVLFEPFTQTDRLTANSLRLDNSFDTTVRVDFDDKYALPNEMSLMLWTRNQNWFTAPSTQLAGNMCFGGGIGIFTESLSSYPYFALLESGYGHLLGVNNDGVPFLDKSLQPTPTLTATPEFVVIDTDNNFIVWNSDSTHTLAKYDNAGKLLRSINLKLDLDENTHQLLLGQNDDVIAITDKKIYTLNSNLNLVYEPVPWVSLSSTVASFAYNTEEGTAELRFADNVYDSKYINNDHWCLFTDGHLYVKYEQETSYTQVLRFDDEATTFSIDPYNNIWILHGTNKCTIYNTTTKKAEEPFEVGANVNSLDKKISFYCEYQRRTLSHIWRCIIYYTIPQSENGQSLPSIHILDINGKIIRTQGAFEFFNLDQLTILNQNQQTFRFSTKGDFTGYEHRRVFYKISPYNNSPQIALKLSLRDRANPNYAYKLFKSLHPIGDWQSSSWKHLTLTIKNKQYDLYVDGEHIINFSHNGQYQLSYENQPTFFIGSPVGSYFGFNKEIKHNSCIFDGIIQDVKIFDYQLDHFSLQHFLRSVKVTENMLWDLPTPTVQYVETIERMFKNKIPGSKATFFNIKLKGSQITDPQARKIIEQEIRSLVAEIKPTYTDFLSLQWID